MAVIVQKFGGSSVADVPKLQAVAARVVETRRMGHQVVVVVSAMAGTTDRLIGLAQAIDPEPPRRELDMLLSTGERVSMALLCMAIQKAGCDAISFTGSQSGIITNDRHFDARIIDVRPFRIEDELSRGRVVIVAGYQGMSYKREITTLGRGGTDTTAVALAAALGAERAEIYSDVDGVYSADPRLVGDAQHLPELSYEQMQELSSAGAKVLNPQAVSLAAERGVVIHARSTFVPGRETRIGPRPPAAPPRPLAVTGQKGLGELTFEGAWAELTTLLQALEARGIRIHASHIQGERARLLLSGATTGGKTSVGQNLLAQSDAAWSARTNIHEGLGRVSLVSSDNDPSLMSRALTRLTDATIRPHRVSTSALRLEVIVEEAQVDPGVQALHQLIG